MNANARSFYIPLKFRVDSDRKMWNYQAGWDKANVFSMGALNKKVDVRDFSKNDILY